jgi:hypothetical protein
MNGMFYVRLSVMRRYADYLVLVLVLVRALGNLGVRDTRYATQVNFIVSYRFSMDDTVRKLLVQ